MAQVFKSIQMETNMKECSNKEKEVEREPIIFLMVKFTKDNGIMEKQKVLEFANGQMGRFMKVTGQIIKRMDKAFLNGQMEDNIEDIIEMIKNTVKALTLGQMVENTQENGRMIKDMEKANMLLVRMKLKKVYGNKINESNGLNKVHDFN